MRALVVLLALLIGSAAWAVELPQGKAATNLASELGFLRDDKGVMAFERVQRLPPDRFEPLPGRSINHGFTDAAFWYRVALDPAPPGTDWSGVLEVGFAPMDRLDLFVVHGDGRVQAAQGGDTRPPDAPGIRHRNPAFPVHLDPGESATLYLRAQSDGPHEFPLLLWSREGFEAKTASEYLMFGMFYGVMLVMVIYNLLTFVVLRDWAYLYYLSFVATFALILVNLDGFAIPWLWRVGTFAVNAFIPILAAASAMFALLFVRRSLGTGLIAPRLHRLLGIGIVLCGVCLPLPLILPVMTAIFINTLVALLTTALLTAVIVLLAVQGRRTAQFYVLVWAMLAIGVIAKVLEINGLLPVSLMTTYSMHLGACLLVTLVSLGLADQINAMRREHLRLERDRIRAQTAARSEFLAKMSHELRTPMNAIIGFTDLALRSEDDTRRMEHLGHIDTAARSLLHILNDVLDLTRMEAGRLVLESRSFEFQEVLDKVAGLLSRAADAKGLDLVVGRGADLPVLAQGDALRIEQVLINLLGNAIKFTDQGEVELRADLEARAEDRIQVRFTVRDSGIGIATEDLPRLFTPFTQVDPSMTRRHGGSGLGLAVSRQLVELMGGRIEVQSESGIGTEMRVLLPLRAGPETTDTRQALAGRRILVAAANGSLRRMYAQTLGAMGAAEDCTDTVAGIMGLLRRHPIDALLLDTRLREGDGLEALRLIRANADTHDLPVIVMIGHGNEAAIREAIGVGASACLTRPIKPALLAQTLDEFLKAGAPTRGVRREHVGQTVAARQLRGARVLLVEDNAINRRLASEVLGDAGVQVDSADDGQQAVDAVQRERYDAVLMDLQMPVLDGFGATRAIRALPDRDRLPIIAMTANAMQQDRDQAHACGMNDFLPKPIDAEQLLSTLARWVQRPASGDPGASDNEFDTTARVG